MLKKSVLREVLTDPDFNQAMPEKLPTNPTNVGTTKTATSNFSKAHAETNSKTIVNDSALTEQASILT